MSNIKPGGEPDRIEIEVVGGPLPVVLLDRRLIEDASLSWTALGILVALRSGLVVTATNLDDLAGDLCAERHDHPTEVRDALRDLVRAGYIRLPGGAA